MDNIIYRLEDGRLWNVPEAKWTNPANIATLLLETFSEDESEESLAEGRFRIIDLVSAEGVSNEKYLAATLAFYDYPLGELAMLTAKGIQEELDRLDAEYLTPRILAGLATGDKFALSQWHEHEEKAAPLRKRFEELEADS